VHRTQIIDETGEKEPYTEEHHCFTFTYGGDLDGIDEPGATLGFTGEHVCVGLLLSSTSPFSLFLSFCLFWWMTKVRGGVVPCTMHAGLGTVRRLAMFC
jgi:hypothetical protein